MRRRKGRKTYLNSQGPVLRSYKTASYKSVTITFVNVHSLMFMHEFSQMRPVYTCNFLQLATCDFQSNAFTNMNNDFSQCDQFAQSCNLLSCNFVKRDPLLDGRLCLEVFVGRYSHCQQLISKYLLHLPYNLATFSDKQVGTAPPHPLCARYLSKSRSCIFAHGTRTSNLPPYVCTHLHTGMCVSRTLN